VEVLAKLGVSEKKYEKFHFMLIFGELLVCSLQRKSQFSFFVLFGKKVIEFCKYLSDILIKIKGNF